jgi:hypothetical protein
VKKHIFFYSKPFFYFFNMNASDWNTLPLPALRAVFEHLEETDRQNAANVCTTWTSEMTRMRMAHAKRLLNMAFRWCAVNEGNLMLAGGMARWLWDKCPTTWFPSDADLFWCAKSVGEKDESMPPGCMIQTVNAPLNTPPLLNAYSGEPELISFVVDGCPRVVNFQYSFGRVQLIMSAFTSPPAVLDSFDLSVAMVGYMAKDTCLLSDLFTSNSMVVYTTPPEYHDQTATPSHWVSQRDRTVRRLAKYRRRLPLIQDDAVEFTEGNTPNAFLHIYMKSSPAPHRSVYRF